MNNIINIPQPKQPKQSNTESALTMLNCIMQKITYETVSALNQKPNWYDEMAGIAVGLADIINQIENSVEPVSSVYNNTNTDSDL